MTRDGLVAEFGFAGHWKDTSGRGHELAATGAPAFARLPDGPCLELDGRSHLDMPLPPETLGDTFTVECRVHPARPAGGENPGGWGAVWRIVGLVVFEKIIGVDRFRLQGFERIQGNETYGLWWPGKAYRGAPMPPDRWYHVAAVFSPKLTGWYVNGVAVETFPEGLDLSLQQGTLQIGKDFHGLLADFRVWRKPLSELGIPVPAAQRVRSFADLAQVEAAPAGCRGVHRLCLSEAYRRAVPAGIDHLSVSMSCVPLGSWNEAPASLGEVRLARARGFAAEVDLAGHLSPGQYMVTAAPVLGGKSPLPLEPRYFGVQVEPPRKALAPARVEGRPARTLTQVFRLDGPDWWIAIDPDNKGRERKWWKGPVPGAKPTKVPWAIQERFPGYHGVAWYWRRFKAAANPHRSGRYLLRFAAVDYLAEVWLNGRRVGGHRGGETPFALDVTGAIRPGRVNRLAVRVLNPTDAAIDGMTLYHTAKSPKFHPVQPNAGYNAGGIIGAVSLAACPPLRIEDVTAAPDWARGDVRIGVSLHNAGRHAARAEVTVSIAPAAGEGTVGQWAFLQDCPPGASLHDTVCRVADHRLWELNDPRLYRLTVRVQRRGEASADERTVRFGFRDFRFERGAFRLNGRRIFLNGAAHMPEYPVTYVTPHDVDYFRRDMVALKAMGLNFCRVAFGTLTPLQLDACDELGLLLVQSHRGCWQLDWRFREWDGMEKEFDRSIAEVVLRDRNHPSIVIWDWMNETLEGRLFRHAVGELQFLRQLDGSRMVLLNSGRSDQCTSIGDLSNPGSLRWDGVVRDGHLYPLVPHTAAISRAIRAVPGAPFILTEYSQCGAIDCPAMLRHLEQIGMEHGDDADYFRQRLRQFMADWRRWRLDECWTRPEDFFEQSHRNVARLRRTSAREALANPNLVGHAMWNSMVDLYQGCGSLNLFREFKPDHADLMFQAGSPLQWCLFPEPITVYRGGSVELEAVLANHDVLAPGRYPVRFQVVSDDGKTTVLDQVVRINVPRPRRGQEPPPAFLAMRKRLRIDAPEGRYRFLATFQRGGAATGGQSDLHVLDPARMPRVRTPVACIGASAALEQWMKKANIRFHTFAAPEDGRTGSRDGQVILAMGAVPAADVQAVLTSLALRVSRGATLIVLTPEFFVGLAGRRNLGNIAGLDPGVFNSLRPAGNTIPLVGKGRLASLSEVGGYYRPDDWAKQHPMLEGVHRRGILDYEVFRELIPQEAYADLGDVEEAVAGGIRVGGGGLKTSYASGLHLCVHRAGRGRVILNTFKILPNLGKDPVAERLFRNMLNYAAVRPNYQAQATP